MRRGGRFLILAAVLATAVGGCATEDGGEITATRETLPNGGERVSYAALDTTGAPLLTPDLRIGSIEGDGPEVFGQVRSIDADSVGNIYVLDFQASEIRVFGPTGSHLRTLGGAGRGPGEMAEANGFAIAGDGTLWLQDHGQYQFIRLDLEGEEVERVPMHVRNYSFMWNGALDDHGRLWKPTNHSNEGFAGPPEAGLYEGPPSRQYQVSLEPGTGARDSIFLGERRGGRAWVMTFDGGGVGFRSIPFDPRADAAIDPAGGVWMTYGADYRVFHLNEQGDTTLVIEADVSPLPVTDEDRQRLRAQAEEAGPEQLEATVAIEEYIPETKPAIAGLVADDEGRIWVERTVAEGENPLYDIFDGSGDYLGSVRLAFAPMPFFDPRIRQGRFYTVLDHELDVPVVVRAAVPGLGG